MKKFGSLFTFSIYLIAITIISAVIFIYYFNKQLGAGLIKCAEDEVRHLISIVMNNCVQKYLDETDTFKLLTIERDNNEVIKRIQYDTKILNQTRNKIIDILETDLDNLVKGKIKEINLNINKLSQEYYEKTDNGIVFMVSIGSVSGNPFFANIGPKIPLNLKPIGDATANILTNITEYGMNNALIEISIELTATIVIHMPFLSKNVTIKNIIPLNLEIIQGAIPNYYLNYGLQ